MKKSVKKVREWHAPSGQNHYGSYMGKGIKNKTGTMKMESFTELGPKGKKGKPPKALA